MANSELDDDLRAKEGASDLVQQTFAKAVQEFAHFPGRSAKELQAWLRCILLNMLIDVRRRYRGTAKRRIDCEVALDAAGSHASLAADSASPSQQAIRQEEAQALEQALSRLPEHYRQVIRCRNEERRSYEEIGQLLGCSADAVRMLWVRAIARLALEMGPLL